MEGEDMIDFQKLLNLQLMMFLYIFIGIVLRKRKIVSSEGRKNMTELLINVILPANIIRSFQIEMNSDIVKTTFWVLIIAFGIQILSLWLSKILYIKVPERKRQVLQYATICSNAGFMGNPMVEGMYGTLGLLYASVYLIPLRFFMWSAGLSCFTKASKKDIIKKLLIHPCIIAVAIGFATMISQIQLPTFIQTSINGLSSSNLSMSMIIIGTILADVKIKSIIQRLNIYFAFVRLILIPGIVLLFCIIIKLDTMVTGVVTVLAGMPAGSTTAILAAKYDGDAEYASSCIFFSTIVSLITIPLLSMLIQ